MTTTDETPVNGHQHNLAALAPFRPVAPRSVGPAIPIEQTQPITTVDSPAGPGEFTGDIEPLGQSDPPAAARPAEPGQVSRAAAPDLAESPLPALPADPDSGSDRFRVDRVYWGHRALVAVYWIAILTGALGQIVFFGSLFGMGPWGYAAAAVIATTAETVMVSACDTALKHRIYAGRGNARRRWVPFLLVSFAAAAAASGMNLSHFWHLNISLAVLFGGVSALGFLLHVIDGFVKGSDYLDRKKTYDEAVADRQRQERQRAQARYERELAAWETQQEAARRAAEQAEQDETAPARQESAPSPDPSVKPPATRKSTKGKAQQSKTTSQRFDRDTALRVLGDEFWDLGPAEVNSRMAEHGYQRLSPSTIRRWRKEGDQ